MPLQGRGICAVCCRVEALPYPAWAIVGPCKPNAAGQKELTQAQLEDQRFCFAGEHKVDIQLHAAFNFCEG